MKKSFASCLTLGKVVITLEASLETTQRIAMITHIEYDTAACQHSQNDGSTEYFGLVVHAVIEGEARRLFFRTSEARYPGNDAMVSLLSEIVAKFSQDV
jgi:hypothetical protein